MTAINKIYLQVLAQLVAWENLVCASPWMLKPRMVSLSVFRQLSPLVRKDLAKKYLFCSCKINYPKNWDASIRLTIDVNS
jgi:hypothetical protein